MDDARRGPEVAPLADSSRADSADSRGGVTIGALHRQRVAAHGDRPALTYYDGETGERTELSHATLENWVSKTANLLHEELGLSPGETLGLRLTDHWTTVVIALAAWRAGLVVSLSVDGLADAAAVHTGLLGDRATLPDRLLLVGSGTDEDLESRSPGEVVFDQEVLTFADDFWDPALGPGDEALVGVVHGEVETVTARLTHGQLLEAGGQVSARLGLAEGGRLLSTVPLEDVAGFVIGPVASLVAGASLVFVARPTSGLASWLEAERCDVAVAEELGDHPLARQVSVAPAPEGAPGLAVT